MSTDWRALCEELVQLDTEQPSEYADWKQRWKAATKRARAALARQEGEGVGPTDEEIIQEAIKADLVYRPIDEEPYVFSGFVESHSLNQYILRFARAVLSRWGRPAPAPPTEGEVAELVEWLRDDLELYPAEKRRAADLLERQSAPVPVPVSERLPGAEDCDAEGRCWWWDGEWGLVEQRFTDHHATHWLPAQALPLPSVEVEA